MTRPAFHILLFILITFARVVSADVTEVDNEKLEQLRAEGVVIVDVRRQDEWEHTGMIEGSFPLTFFDEKGRYDAEAWLNRLNTFVNPDEKVVLICARGVRSAKIAALLDKRLGYTQMHNVTKGISAWLKEKRPVKPFKP